MSYVGPLSTTFTPKLYRRLISVSQPFETAYYYYFGCKIEDQDKDWALKICCQSFYMKLTNWMCKKPQIHMPFAVPIFRESQQSMQLTATSVLLHKQNLLIK